MVPEYTTVATLIRKTGAQILSGIFSSFSVVTKPAPRFCRNKVEVYLVVTNTIHYMFVFIIFAQGAMFSLIIMHTESKKYTHFHSLRTVRATRDRLTDRVFLRRAASIVFAYSHSKCELLGHRFVA